MTEANDDDRRSQLVDRLWRLKQLLASQSGRYVHFNMLLNDADYRQETIEYALSSDDSQVRELAHEAYQLNIGGQLLNPPAAQVDVAPSLPPHATPKLSSGQARALAAEPAHHGMPPARRGFPWLNLVFGLFGLLGLAVLIIQFIPGKMGGLLGKTETISGAILQDTTWYSHTTYRLQGIVYVESGVRLTIQPGTKILGEQGSALIVTRDGTIYARGQSKQPIVFTSANPAGERKRGDWGGLVLLGNAPINRGTAYIEGLPPNEARGSFGGSDIHNNCGVLEYVRIEFAGFEIGQNNELNGLTLGGCGDGTIIRHVQSHMGLDDGIEVFGGNVDLRNIVVTGAGDDAFDWDMGWRGRVQFLVVQQYADDGDNGFEGDNWKERPNASPRSMPTFYNVTMIGSSADGLAQRAMTLRRGTGGIFRNFIIMGFPYEAIDIVGTETGDLLKTGELDFKGMILFDIGPRGRQFFLDDTDDDGGLDEEAIFAESGRGVRFNENPGLSIKVFDRERPDFVPAADSTARIGAASLPKKGEGLIAEHEFWDEAADYLGAIRPGGAVTWLDHWTAYPRD